MAKKNTNSDGVQGGEPVIRQLTANTQIVFTLKSFIATIGTILTLFFGFYQIVIVPKVDKTEEYYKTMFTDQKEQNRLFYQELGRINTSIGSLNANIEALNKQHNGNSNVSNSGGSFNSDVADKGR